MKPRIHKSDASPLEHQIVLFSTKTDLFFSFDESNGTHASFGIWRESVKKHAAKTIWTNTDGEVIAKAADFEPSMFNIIVATSAASTEQKAGEIAKEWAEKFYLAHPDVDFKVVCIQRNIVVRTSVFFEPLSDSAQQNLYRLLQNSPESELVSWELKEEIILKTEHPPHRTMPLRYFYFLHINGCDEKAELLVEKFKNWNRHPEYIFAPSTENHYKNTSIVGDMHQEQEKALTRVAGERPLLTKPKL